MELSEKSRPSTIVTTLARLQMEIKCPFSWIKYHENAGCGPRLERARYLHYYRRAGIKCMKVHSRASCEALDLLHRIALREIKLDTPHLKHSITRLWKALCNYFLRFSKKFWAQLLWLFFNRLIQCEPLFSSPLFGNHDIFYRESRDIEQKSKITVMHYSLNI